MHIVERDQQTIDDSVHLAKCQIQLGGELRTDSVLFHCHIKQDIYRWPKLQLLGRN
jgi:hypothetical protein